jgi:replicative DNA helicase
MQAAKWATVVSDLMAELTDTDSAEVAEFAARNPTPLTHSGELPVFPTDALPESLAAMVAAVARFTATDAGMAGPVALAAIAAIAGGHVEVEVRPGYREPLNVWCLVVANPAERKSSVQGALTAPVLDFERDLVDGAAPTIIEQRSRRDIADKASEAAHKIAGNSSASDRDDLTRNAVAQAAAAEEIVVPAMPRLILDDCTPEAMVSALAEQGGRIAVISSEGGIFSAIAGRYADAPPDAWLKSWSGDPIRVDRRGRKAEYIERPALTLCVMVQPGVLRTAAKRADFRGSGLLARFLYSAPASTLGHRDADPAPVPAAVKAAYADALLTLGRRLHDLPGGLVIRLAPDADRVRLDFAEEVEPRLGADGDLSHVADWAGKLVGTTVRIAGLLHLASDPRNALHTPISAPTMRNAVSLSRYFIPNALVTFDGMACASDDMTTARQLRALIQRKGFDTFSAREAFSAASRTWAPDMSTLMAALEVLVDHGWCEPIPTEERCRPGRPLSPMYRTHPAAFNPDS